jgi:hypothetical protein
MLFEDEECSAACIDLGTRGHGHGCAAWINMCSILPLGSHRPSNTIIITWLHGIRLGISMSMFAY